MNTGGSYIEEKNKKPTLVERGGEDHPDGNRPRNANGKPLDMVKESSAPTPATSATKKSVKGEK